MTIRFDFAGKVAIVTGASAGIGKLTAELLAAAGAATAFVSRRGTDDARGERRMSVQADLTDERQVRDMVAAVLERFGTVDFLVNCAAINLPLRPIEAVTLEEWDQVMRTNLTAVFLSCKHVVPTLKEKRSGRIVNVSSVAGRFRSTLSPIQYVTSKAAVIGFTRQLAYELASFQINVNVACPSQTETEMLRASLMPGDREKLERAIPLGRIATVEEQAHVILFLLSEGASYITGAAIDINGGQL